MSGYNTFGASGGLENFGHILRDANTGKISRRKDYFYLIEIVILENYAIRVIYSIQQICEPLLTTDSTFIPSLHRDAMNRNNSKTM